MPKLSEETYPSGIDPHETWDFQDSSKISCFQHCPRKYFFKYVLGLGSDSPNHNLEFGQAWHDAMEVLLQLYKKNNNVYDPSMVEPAIGAFEKHYRKYFDEETDLDTPKNPGRARIALLEYMNEYHRDNFDVIGTEQYFKVNLGNDRILVGKLDAPIQEQDGKVQVLEHKTTSWAQSSWSEQWPNKIQITNYSLIGFILFEKFKGLIINGAKFFPKNNAFERVYVRKNHDSLEDSLSTVSFWIDLIFMNFEMMAKTKEDAKVMNSFPRNGESCIMFNTACQFKHFCDVCTNPINEVETLRRNFSTIWWNPIEENPDIKELTL